MKIIDWIKNLLHVHTKIWTSRELICRTFVDCSLDHRYIDLQPANIYLWEGYCVKCNKKLSKVETVLEIFDKNEHEEIRNENKK